VLCPSLSDECSGPPRTPRGSYVRSGRKILARLIGRPVRGHLLLLVQATCARRRRSKREEDGGLMYGVKKKKEGLLSFSVIKIKPLKYLTHFKMRIHVAGHLAWLGGEARGDLN
jgi:hypothetical protein